MIGSGNIRKVLIAASAFVGGGAATTAYTNYSEPTLYTPPSSGKLDEIPEKFKKVGIPFSSLIHHYEGYSAQLNFKTGCPDWVLEHLTKDNLKGAASRTGLSFIVDQLVPPQFRVRNEDYAVTGWSKGHMAPAADCRQSDNAMKETFILNSNIVPQDKENNCWYWSRIEYLVRGFTKEYKDVWVLSGPLWLTEDYKVATSPEEATKPEFVDHSKLANKSAFTSDPASSSLTLYNAKKRAAPQKIVTEVIGEHQVHVPTHIFKAILTSKPSNTTPKGKAALTFDGNDYFFGAYIIPNKPIDEKMPLSYYAVPKEVLERLAGFEIYPEFFQDKKKVLDLTYQPKTILIDAAKYKTMVNSK